MNALVPSLSCDYLRRNDKAELGRIAFIMNWGGGIMQNLNYEITIPDLDCQLVQCKT